MNYKQYLVIFCLSVGVIVGSQDDLSLCDTHEMYDKKKVELAQLKEDIAKKHASFVYYRQRALHDLDPLEMEGIEKEFDDLLDELDTVLESLGEAHLMLGNDLFDQTDRNSVPYFIFQTTVARHELHKMNDRQVALVQEMHALEVQLRALDS